MIHPWTLLRKLGLTESVMLAYARDFDAALTLAVGPIGLDPQFPEGYHIAGYVHLGRKEYDRAASLLPTSPMTRTDH